MSVFMCRRRDALVASTFSSRRQHARHLNELAIIIDSSYMMYNNIRTC